ncbi:copine-8-like isoform X1 [Watersipora subatra]|uniref:copine-8-like isoform X1 n=1 Tax=Watersipora subatra TaxID=2589382 RepID=UPI00355BA42F
MQGGDSTFNPGASVVPSTKVELTISCRNLIDADLFSKSDPMCVMSVKQFATENWREYGRTETIWDNLNPDFVKKFEIDYYFEERQQLKFSIYDVDSNSPDLSKHDFLGTMECSLGEIVSAGRLKRALKGPKANSGSIVAVSSEELSSCKEELSLVLRGEGLDKKDFFGKSDPFLVFHKVNEDGLYTITHKTEYIKNTLKPKWKRMRIPVRVLCNGDYDRSIKVECFDWNSNGSHEIIGYFLTNLRELSAAKGKPFHLINDQKKLKKGSKYKNSGIVLLDDYQVHPVYSFVDYITGGCQLHATIAVDFTASNGDPRDPKSLHYNNQFQPNQYEMAIRSVGEIIQDYDSDKLFPALGFGARLPPDGRVSHEFFLNGDSHSPYCQGIDGVLQAYKHSLNTVQLYGPTNFAPIINHVARFAAERREGTDYFILLIITDGIITDMPQTKSAIVNAARLPMSIIIIGVGSADFKDMDILDGDDVRVSYNGITAERDIVQFVPFLEFTAKRPGDTLISTKARLAKEVLAEIPEQFTLYMKARGIKPRPPLDRTSSLASGIGQPAR